MTIAILDGIKYSNEEAKNILKQWDGYIDLEGRYWASKPTGVMYWQGSASCHEDMAAKILQENIGDFHSYKDRLVHGVGWISCTFWLSITGNLGTVGILLPREHKLTEAQKNTLLEVFLARGLDLNEYFRMTEREVDI